MQSNKEELRYLKMIPPFFSVKKQQERGGRASATAEVADGGHVDQELIAVVLLALHLCKGLLLLFRWYL